MNNTFCFSRDGKVESSELDQLVKLPIKIDSNLSNFGPSYRHSNPEHTKVAYGKFEISQNLLHSNKYYDCCGLVLLGNGWGVLSHMDIEGYAPTRCDSPEKYVNGMVDSLLEKTSLDSIIGIPIGGVSDHLQQIAGVLRGRGVMVENHFSDNYPGSDSLSGQQKKLVCHERSITVDPATQLVVVLATFQGYRTRLLRLHGGSEE